MHIDKSADEIRGNDETEFDTIYIICISALCIDGVALWLCKPDRAGGAVYRNKQATGRYGTGNGNFSGERESG